MATMNSTSQVVPVVKKKKKKKNQLPANAEDVRDAGLIPGLGRSPGGGDGYPSSILAWKMNEHRNLAGYSS